MTALLTLLAAAFALGVVTSFSPCPMTANVAAVVFLTQPGPGRRAWKAGLAYAGGRMAAYGVLGVAVLLLLGGGDGGGLARFLQRYANQLLGPVLILAGMVLTGLLRPWTSLSFAGPRAHRHATGGWLGAFALGALLALSFCPTSATLFFGGLLGLWTPSGGVWLAVLLPLAFGLGEALPVLLTTLLSRSATAAMKVFRRLRQLDRIVRALGGMILITIGMRYCLVHIWGM